MAVAVRPNPSPPLDEPALEAASLFERYSERIYAYCLHVLRDRAEAEDAVQTTFLNAHRALRRGVRPEHEYAWLHTIAKNACRTLQRTRGRRAPVAVDVDVDSIPGHEADGEVEELRAFLAEALAGLPESQRRAVVLREWHGLTPIEIAARLGLSVPATYALLTRARRSLSNSLKSKVRGPLSALDVGAVGDLVRAFAKTLFGSAGSKATVAAAVATVSVGVGGVVVERSQGDPPDRSARPAEQVAAPALATPSAKGAVGAPRAREAGDLSQRRGGGRVGTPQVETGSRPAATAAAKPASGPETTRVATPPGQKPPAAPPLDTEPPAPPVAVESPVQLPGVPPLLPDLTSGDPLPPVGVPPLPEVPELPVEVEVEPPHPPLP